MTRRATACVPPLLRAARLLLAALLAGGAAPALLAGGAAPALLPAQAATGAPARAAVAPAAPAARAFVRVRDGRLTIGERPYHFAGVNLWFGMNLGADSSVAGADRARLVRELDRLQALGVDNVRLMASSEGPGGEPDRVAPAVQDAPGVYDERLLRGLDFLLAELARRGMRGVLILNNFFQWSGGMAQYVAWATGTPIPYPERDGHGWDDFQQYSARFYTNDRAQALFERYVAAVAFRRNTVTGVAYRDDPTIMSWQLSNEPRGWAQSEAYVRWVDRAARFVKRVAPRQLVSLGGEGKLDRATGASGTQFERVARTPALDYLTVHIWVQNWGWFDPTRPEATWDVAMGRTMGYLADHVAIARAVGKPLVVEEFGVGRDGGSYDPAAPVTYRDRFVATLLEAVHFLAVEGTPVAGANLWSWSGEARPTRVGGKWAAGDPLMADPPHERQGWYAVYADDTTTTALLRHYAARMRAVADEARVDPRLPRAAAARGTAASATPAVGAARRPTAP